MAFCLLYAGTPHVCAKKRKPADPNILVIVHHRHNLSFQIIDFVEISPAADLNLVNLPQHLMPPPRCLSARVGAAPPPLRRSTDASVRTVVHGESLQCRCSWTCRRAGTGTHATERVGRRAVRAHPGCQLGHARELHSSNAAALPSRLERRKARSGGVVASGLVQILGRRPGRHALAPRWHGTTPSGAGRRNGRNGRRDGQRVGRRWWVLLLVVV